MRGPGERAKKALGGIFFGALLLAGHRPKRAVDEHDERTRSPLAAVLAEWAAQDFVVLAYLVVLFLAVFHGAGPRRPMALAFTVADVVVFATLVTAARRRWLGESASAVLYRAALVFGILGSFFQLQWVLPAASATTVDAQLYAFDRAIFGGEPAELFDRVTTPTTTEWFAFFYFGYFPLLGAYVLPSLLFGRADRRLAELSFGIAWLFCVAHVMYLVVPGYGPYVHLADRFTHRLEGPTFWPLVQATVDSVDITSRTDIFPSLHTAGPTFLAVYAFRNRRVAPFRWTWAPTAFAASQIILATMFLRWHYLVDVCAGLVHGFATAWVASAVTSWEAERRTAAGRMPVWTTPWRHPRQPREPSTVSATFVRPSLLARSPAQAPDARSSSRQTSGRRS